MKITTTVTTIICLAISSIIAGLELLDSSIHQYSGEGGIFQFEYAWRRILQSTPIVGWIDDSSNSTVILSSSPKQSSLQTVKSSSFRVFENSVLVAGTGYSPDWTRSATYVNELVQSHGFMFEEVPFIDMIGSKLATWLTRGKVEAVEWPAITRPLAVDLLLSQFDEISSKPRLVLAEHNGLSRKCQYAVIGGVGQVDLEGVTTVITTQQLSRNEKILKISKILSSPSRVAGAGNRDYEFQCAIVSRNGVRVSKLFDESHLQLAQWLDNQ